MIDLFFFDIEIYTRAISVESINDLVAFENFIKKKIFQMISGQLALQHVVQQRDDLPDFYPCPYAWNNHPLSSLRFSVKELTDFGQSLQSQVRKISEFMRTTKYKNRYPLFLTVMSPPLITVSSCPITSITSKNFGCFIEYAQDGARLKSNLDAFSWNTHSNGFDNIHYGFLFDALQVKPIVGIFDPKSVREKFSTIGASQEDLSNEIHADPTRRNFRRHLGEITRDMEAFISKTNELIAGVSLRDFRVSLSRSRNDTWYGALPQGSMLHIFHKQYLGNGKIRSLQDIPAAAHPYAIPRLLTQAFGQMDFEGLAILSNKMTGASFKSGYPPTSREIEAASNFRQLTGADFIRVDRQKGLTWPIL